MKSNQQRRFISFKNNILDIVGNRSGHYRHTSVCLGGLELFPAIGGSGNRGYLSCVTGDDGDSFRVDVWYVLIDIARMEYYGGCWWSFCTKICKDRSQAQRQYGEILSVFLAQYFIFRWRIPHSEIRSCDAANAHGLYVKMFFDVLFARCHPTPYVNRVFKCQSGGEWLNSSSLDNICYFRVGNLKESI